MPFLKPIDKFQPPWKDWDRRAQKEGLHATFYTTNKNQYIGEWHDNLKEGKGVYHWLDRGEIYEGEWKADKRNGFGNLSVKQPDGNYKKIYSGGWKNNRQHGYGTYYLSDEDYYEGEWFNGKKSGWGRNYYNNGDIYEGEWLNDMRHGRGMFRLVNHNRYEGDWKNDKKNGHGKFFFLNKGQMLEGFWVDDINKAGKMVDFDRETATDCTQYELPKNHLEKPDNVIEEAVENFQNFQQQ